MNPRTLAGIGVTAMFVAVAAATGAQVNLPLTDGLTLAPTGGVKGTLTRSASPEGGAAVRIAFTKNSEERRLLAIEARPEGDANGAKAVARRYRLQLAKGEPPRFAIVLFDRDGGAWFKVGFEPLVVGKWGDGRLSVASLRQAAFSEDRSGQLEWNNIQKAWFGLVMDGPARGTLELSQVRLTSEPYRPTRPLIITGGDDPGKWSVGKDPAVQATLTTPNEGPDGRPCMKFEFRLATGRHMYAIPSTPLPAAEVEGYRALRFTYKATIPDGIKGLLVMLGERGGAQYWADPMPPPSEDWTTITIPFEDFTLGTWTRDDNQMLDIEQVGRVFIGVHGTATGPDGAGTIWATDVQFLP
ncbi:MAG: hypothetical protein ACE5O2_12710 [Armatimonadota bacterium]